MLEPTRHPRIAGFVVVQDFDAPFWGIGPSPASAMADALWELESAGIHVLKEPPTFDNFQVPYIVRSDLSSEPASAALINKIRSFGGEIQNWTICGDVYCLNYEAGEKE